MSSVFAGAERRKKVVTYGRAARPSTAQIFVNDAPSPERPRKPAGRLPNGSQKLGAASGAGDASHVSRMHRNKSPAPHDEFDVPSDDEPTPRAIPVKKVLPKPKPLPKPVDRVDAWDVPSSGDERRATKPGKNQATKVLRKTNATRPKKPVQQTKAQGEKQLTGSSSEDPLTTAVPAARIRAKTPAAALKPQASKINTTKQTVSTAKPASKPTAPGPQVIIQQKKVKPAAAASVKDTAPTPPIETSSDVFDVPSSEDDAPARTPVRGRKPSTARAKIPPKPSTSRMPLSPEPSAESDTSNASRKRKRHGSVSSSATAKKLDAIQRKREASVSQRTRKYPRTENSVSPGHTADEPSQPTLVAVIHDPPINKPKRTKTRTVPVTSRAPITKAQSSPVKLHSMLAMRSATKPLPVQETPEAPLVEDETMYDIPEEKTPLARSTNHHTPGSVTPRQRDLFSNLLDDGSEMSATMPSISKLRLTDRTPGPGIASLTRSSSDVPQSEHSRKGRLIDMLKRAAPSSEQDSESDEETEEEITEIPAVSSQPRTRPARTFTSSQEGTEEMDVDQDTQTSSQTSRPATLARDTSRTYANTRSYLEEANLEDGILNWNEDIDMDMGDRQSSVTGSEDDSQQVTALPQLRRKGQLYKFEAETQAMIEDISGRTSTNNSARRSAMMEFASKMADEIFVNQLLESAMTSSLLRAISATGDMVFDFAATATVLFVLRTKPSYAVVEQIYQCDTLSTLRKLLASPMSGFDIYRIAKDRKTNMAPSARETVAEFRTLVLKTLDWPADDVLKLSPQLLAIKVLEELIIGLRAPGNTESIVDEGMVGKVLDAASGPLQRLRSGIATAQDDLLLETTLSALEALSISKEEKATWSDGILRRLADMMSAFFDTSRSSPNRLVIRLCMNLANSRPKACQIFADEAFVTRLTRFIVECFGLLGSKTTVHVGVRDDLILGLGAMMNLAEFSDEARLSVMRGEDDLIGELVKIFLEGSERADRVSLQLACHPCNFSYLG